jgi:TIGR03009 family protein
MRLVDGSFGAAVQLSTVPAQGQPSRVVEKYVCTGTHIYNISPDTKTVDIYTLPARQPGQPLDDGPMPFLTGMKAEVARKRYQLVAKEPTDEKGKPWYTFVEAKPNFPRDQQDFVKARMVIMKRDLLERDTQRLLIPTGMPRELFWVEPNNNTTKWEIIRVLRNVPNSVDRKEFVKPDVPADWKVQNVSTTAPARPPSGGGEPRVIRNQDR